MKAPRRLMMAGAPVALTGLVFLSTGASARADDGSSAQPGSAAGPVSMSAQAVAIQNVYQSLNVPFGLPFAVGSYGASAKVDGGGSTSDAGAPYSPLLSSLPSAGNGLASSMGYPLPLVPTLPGYVSAQYPNVPTAEQSAGVYELIASTGAAEATGRVNVGGERSIAEKNNLFALAHTLSKEGMSSVDADAGAIALSLPGILDLANVSSQIHVSQADGDAQPTFTSTTSLGTITVAGTTTGATGNGSQVAGAKSMPINSDTLPAINQVLAPVGVSLTYLPESFVYSDGTWSTGPEPHASKILRGVTSGALQILYQKDIQGQGTTTETITVGQVSVTAQGEPRAAPPPAVGAASGRADPSTVGPSAGAPPTSTATIPGPVLSTAEAPASAVIVPANVALVQDQASTGVPAMDGIRAEVARIQRLNFSLDGTYSMVVVLGALMLSGSVLSRLLGVRL